MSIRRIAELPSVENATIRLRKSSVEGETELSVLSVLSDYYITYDKKADLSDCILEVSVPNDPISYSSMHINGENIADIAVTKIQSEIIYYLIVCGTTVILSSNTRMDNSILELQNGSSIIAWTNVNSAVETSCYLHFNDIKLSSDSNIDIESHEILRMNGNPVIINDNVKVYQDRMNSDKQIVFSNQSNKLSVKYEDFKNTSKSNCIATCKALSELIG